MDLKDTIKELCKERNVTANQVEQECKLGQGFISKMDKSSPKIENIQKIADYLDVSVDYIMGRTDDQQVSTPGYVDKKGYEVYESILKERGITSSQVSKATGISRATLSQWKAGMYDLKYQNYEKIAKFLGVDTDYLRTGKMPESGTVLNSEALEDVKKLYETPGVRVLIESVRGLDQRRILKYAEFIREMRDSTHESI